MSANRKREGRQPYQRNFAQPSIDDDDDGPCPLCQGDPKRTLGGIHAGRANPDTGAVTCPNCGETADRTKWD